MIAVSRLAKISGKGERRLPGRSYPAPNSLYKLFAAFKVPNML